MKKRILLLIGFVLAYLLFEYLLSLGFSKILKLILTEKQWKSELPDVMVQYSTLFTFILFVWIFNRKSKHPFRLRDFKLKDLFYGFTALSCIIFTNVGIRLTAKYFSIPVSVSANQNAINAMLHQYLIPVILITVIIAPLSEEFIFRKVIIGHLFAQKKVIGLFVSSILFGLGHMIAGFDWISLLIYSSMGLIFGLFYLKTKRIETSITAHVVNNLCMTLLLLPSIV